MSRREKTKTKEQGREPQKDDILFFGRGGDRKWKEQWGGEFTKIFCSEETGVGGEDVVEATGGIGVGGVG